MNDALLADLCNLDRVPFHRLPTEAQAYMRAHPSLVQWWSRDDMAWIKPSAAPMNWNLEIYRIPDLAPELPETRPIGENNDRILDPLLPLPTASDLCHRATLLSLVDALAKAGGITDLGAWLDRPLREVIATLAPNGIRFCYVPDALGKAETVLYEAKKIYSTTP